MGGEDISKFALTEEERLKIKEQKENRIRIDEEQKAKAGSWTGQTAQKASVREFISFTWPFLWKGGWQVKVTTFLTFIMLISSRALTVVHPLILRRVI